MNPATVHPTAVVEDGAEIGPGTIVGPYAVVGPKVRIGSGCTVGAHAVLSGNTRLGEGSVVVWSKVVAKPKYACIDGRHAPER